MKFLTKQNGSQNTQFIFNVENALGNESARLLREAAERRDYENMSRAERQNLAQQIQQNLVPHQATLEPLVANFKAGNIRGREVRQFKQIMRNAGHIIRVNRNYDDTARQLVRAYEGQFGVVGSAAANASTAPRTQPAAPAANVESGSGVPSLAERSRAEIRELQSDAKMAEMYADYQAGNRDPHFIGDFQAGLTSLGFDTNGVEGIAGSGTRRAIRQYEAFTGNRSTSGGETAEASTEAAPSALQQLANRISRESANQSYNRLLANIIDVYHDGDADPDAVAQIQIRLTRLGENPGTIDNADGSNTRGAVLRKLNESRFFNLSGSFEDQIGQFAEQYPQVLGRLSRV